MYMFLYINMQDRYKCIILFYLIYIKKAGLHLFYLFIFKHALINITVNV